ncbi:GTP-binding protein [Nocardia seriolae]|nr:ATP/GTP-binding protein [Nocardia seriolae]MTJ65558.1 ATP-binding protein [Nocardia seriolae]MTJ75116.1 ATP-binding protein [Nocardia seriolae]MTJ90436.1 ATP-binding protein [Nocardia seriolae]MTK34396.1 ATP-binding protein [Nocardia seriolae]MTK43547.1 ATP-binding protein [Nocardia seriolae]
MPLASSVKIVTSGGFGVGKTTFIGAISEIEPRATEAAMTEVSMGVDDPGLATGKTTTTVALDFGRITLDASLVLYLFGTPGQERFEFLWDDLLDGALGGVILVDTGRVEDCYPVLDFFEQRGTPFVVAVNRFEAGARFDLEEVREALDLSPGIHLMDCDARDRESVKSVLVALLEQILRARRTPALAV